MHTTNRQRVSEGPDFWLGLVCALLGVSIVWKASSWEYFADGAPGPGFFPLWYGLLMIAVSAGLMLQAWRNGSAEIGLLAGLRVTAPVWLFYAGFIIALPLIGFLLSYAIFVFALQVAVYRIRPVKALIASVLTSATFFTLFDVLLQIQLPVLLKGIF